MTRTNSSNLQTTRRWQSKSITMVVCAAAFALLLSSYGSVDDSAVDAFEMTMVASRFPTTGPRTTTRAPTIPSVSSPSGTSSPTIGGGITSNLISNLACMALKRRLKTQTHVSCDLSQSMMNSNALLMGRVGPVTVKGRGWGSSLGLTCRAIEATVDTCQLDVPRVLTQQKLVLSRPAEGRAMVALTADDFGNFITHPLMKPPSPPTVGSSSSSSKLEFLKDGVSIDPQQGTVSFFGTYGGSKWKFCLERSASSSSSAAKIRATLVDDDAEAERSEEQHIEEIESALSATSTQFFNEMVFELDGTFLSFEDMALTDKGTEPSVLLKLSILVRKFPSPGLEF